ncbi:MAG: hypothetical protein K2X86_06840, partial [Cytophagaceae bacterium]|nr:hypothetical protein [Cytophagaceae bacterium]
MNNVFLFLLLISIPLLISAQDKIWFQDDFNDNSKGWYLSDYDSPEITRKINNGKYLIHHKNTEGLIYGSFVEIYSNPQKDFSLETNIVQTEGSDINGYGVMISGHTGKVYYFIINAKNRSFWIGTSHKGNWEVINDWQETKIINSGSQNNKLTVVYKKSTITFFVNDKIAYSSSVSNKFQEMLGSASYGIVTFANMKIEVNNFIFRQDNPDIRVVPDLPKLNKANLGPNVNTVNEEKTPLISPDGKTLYYTINGDAKNIGSAKNDDIWYSNAVNDTTWEPRKHFQFPLNNDWPNSVISVTPDNNSLLLMHTYNADGSGKAAGFSISNRTADGWSVPVDLKVANYYNKGGSNEFSLSADRKVLMMAIQRDDSYGLNDIYVSFLQENGEFSEPKNIGNTVNTFAWEASPFLAADGKTLYFSTAGHPGYGSSDIFMTRRLDSTWTKWSEPMNMGPDINSNNWEAYYTVPASGNYAYVISEKNSIGNIDIFRVKLPKALRPEPVVLIYGKVLNSHTKQPLQANIAYNILATNKEIGIASSNP